MFESSVYPTHTNYYKLKEKCGHGTSATVWRASCEHYDGREEIVAAKIFDLNNPELDISLLYREAHTMKLLDHPNVLQLFCSFVVSLKLWMIVPYLAYGSVESILKFQFQNGLREQQIAIIGFEVLKGINYMHKNNFLHRDIKSSNILLDTDGKVILADFSVTTKLDMNISWSHDVYDQTTCVGSPCWMAPEVLTKSNNGSIGYDWRIDIWSFGITLLEMAHGTAPFSEFPPFKTFMLILHQDPPKLKPKQPKRFFSDKMKEVTSMCLQKDFSQRPSAAYLMSHKFFRKIHNRKDLYESLLNGIPEIKERLRTRKNDKENSGNFSRQSFESIDFQDDNICYSNGHKSISNHYNHNTTSNIRFFHEKKYDMQQMLTGDQKEVSVSGIKNFRVNVLLDIKTSILKQGKVIDFKKDTKHKINKGIQTKNFSIMPSLNPYFMVHDRILLKFVKVLIHWIDDFQILLCQTIIQIRRIQINSIRNKVEQFYKSYWLQNSSRCEKLLGTSKTKNTKGKIKFYLKNKNIYERTVRLVILVNQLKI